MGWVVLCHGYLYMQSSGSVKNMAYTMTVQRRLISMLLPFGQFSVDTFFVSRHDIADIWVAFFQECQQYRCGQVLSGFLGAYVGLRKLSAMDKKGQKIPSPPVVAFSFFVERYLRLTPVYLFVLMFYMYLLPFVITVSRIITPPHPPLLSLPLHDG